MLACYVVIFRHAMIVILLLVYLLAVGNVVLGHYSYTNDLRLEAAVWYEVVLPGERGYISTPLNHIM